MLITWTISLEVDVCHRFPPKVSGELFEKTTKNPHVSRNEAWLILEQSGTGASPSTVSNILNRDDLRGCRPRKAPLMRSTHLKARFKFANEPFLKESTYLNSVLW